jgi:hypothetical protein
MGGGVDGRVTDGELVRAVERVDGLAEGGVGDAVGGLDAQKGRVCGIGLLQFRFGGLSDGGKAEKRRHQDRKRLHYIPIEQVRGINGRGVCLVVTIADRELSRCVDLLRQPFSKAQCTRNRPVPKRRLVIPRNRSPLTRILRFRCWR